MLHSHRDETEQDQLQEWEWSAWQQVLSQSHNKENGLQALSLYCRWRTMLPPDHKQRQPWSWPGVIWHTPLIRTMSTHHGQNREHTPKQGDIHIQAVRAPYLPIRKCLPLPASALGMDVHIGLFRQEGTYICNVLWNALNIRIDGHIDGQ